MNKTNDGGYKWSRITTSYNYLMITTCDHGADGYKTLSMCL